MKNKLLIIIAAVVVVIAAATAGIVYNYTSNNYVATVDGEKITKAEYNFFVAVAKKNMEAAAEGALTDEKAKEAFLKDKQEEIKNNALKTAQEFKIQLIKAKEKKLELTSDDKKNMEATIDQMIQSEGGRIAAENKIKADYGINLDQYRSVFRDYVLIDKFIQENKKQIQTTDEEVQKQFDEHKADYGKVTVRHILFKTTAEDNTTPLPEDKQAEVKKKAEDTLAKAKAGQDFATMAKELTEDPGSKDTGGEYTFGKGQMVPEFEEWSFSSDRKPGDMDIVKTTFGYHVMKFEKLEEAKFDDVKASIKDTLNANKFSEAYTKDLEDWKKDPKYNVVKNTKVFNAFSIM